jgi:formate hydrogenlyase subunit 3/multisubunit Na+/H+ antiporter MnhD subunit
MEFKNLKRMRWPRWWTGTLITSTLLFLFFRFYLHQSNLGAIYWIISLFLTGLFPFQFFTPILFGNSHYRTIAYVCIGLRAIGLLLVFLWFQSPELYDTATMNAFYFFPVASIVFASILAFKADHFKHFLACNDALVSGFLVLNSAVFYFLPLPGFGSVALALALILFIVSGLGNTATEANYETDFLALFHDRPCLAFIWIIGLLSLSGILPVGYSWQWRLLSIFYARHQGWLLWPLLIAMVVASCAYGRWIHAAMKYPYMRESQSSTFRSKPTQTLLALAISLLFGLSWIFPLYEP